MSDDLYAIIADQAETIDQLRAELTLVRENLNQASNKLHHMQRGGVEGSHSGDVAYWSGVYNRIRAAWDRWALTELGTASPSPIDLAGRSELAELWEAVK